MSLATTSPRLPIPGLGDLDQSDLSIPRLKIIHRDGVFQDSLSNETFTSLDVVVLGIVKSRILWDTSDDFEDAVPLCKSYDFETGHPDVVTFPWAASKFERGEVASVEPTLSCAACALKDWDSHPTKSIPWCTAQSTFPLLMRDTNGDFTAPALFTVQKTGLKPAKDYAASYQRAQAPMFTAVTRLSLDSLKKGTNPYAVPQFRKLDGTDDAYWNMWAAQFVQIYEFLQTPRHPPV